MAIRKLKKSGKNIRQDGLYRYELVYRCRGDSRQRRKRVWARDDSDADSQLRRLQGRPAVRPTWDDALQVFLRDKEGSRSESYIAGIRHSVSECQKELGNYIQEITIAQMSKFLAEYAQESSGRSANLRLAELLSVARHAMRIEIVSEIPWENTPKRPHRPKERLPVALGKLEEYILAVKAPEAQLPLKLIALTGERVSAILNLLVEDIGDGRITVTKKGGKRRMILLIEPMQDVIQNALKLRQGLKSPPKTLFFNTRGESWNHWSFRNHLSKAQDRAGLARATPHQFRHLIGDLAADSGYSANMIGEVLGHDDAQSSESYVHNNPLRAKEVHAKIFVTYLSRFGKVFGGNGGISKDVRGGKGQSVTCPACGHKHLIDNGGIAKRQRRK